MTTRAEKKVEKQLDRAEKEHDKAALAEAKGHLHSADKHDRRAQGHETKAGTLAHKTGGVPYGGLNFPYTSATQHPVYGYNRLPRDKKAERFDLKAAEWERRGNPTKAQKNRDKALRHRQRLMPGYVQTSQPQQFYVDKANRFDQRAVRYQQLGMLPQAQRYQQRALRTRTKHGLVGGSAFGGTPVASYIGLSQPYTGATQHPTYGYTRLPVSQKSQRYDTKAAEWEKRGNMVKAQKNREKANRYRQASQPGYVKPTRSQAYYIDRASHFDQKAIRYQQMGMNAQALRAQQRAQRIRTKRGIPAGFAGAGMAGVANRGVGGQQYQGLNFPYTGATNHPQYGYPRLTRDQKIKRYEAKAAEYEKRGNTAKAQKNREKVNRHRQMTQPGYVRPQRPQNYYTDRANLFDQRAAHYRQMGMLPQAQRYQGRAQRIRTKHGHGATGFPAGAAGLAGAGGLAGVGANQGGQYTPTGTWVGPLVPAGSSYSGLNFPYANASAHPTYGYQRLTPNQKAERFEQKAAEYERRGNTAKAQKNREKALRYRARTQPGYVQPVRPQSYYVQRANIYDQRALQYQQLGMMTQAQRYHGRSRRVKSKYNIPNNAYPGGTYQGLNLPYNGAETHPTYGYQRLPHNKKAERFEMKAAEYERRGNARKAQKNRDKALRYRARSQPGYARPQRPQTYYVQRANTFDQRAQQYQQWGMLPQAQRYQGRSQRVRAKYNIPVQQTTTTTTVYPSTSSYSSYPATYQGLNLPYTGAETHPTYGYQRLPPNKKAERFELKAAEWERKGNLRKAQKNRDKALRYRARTQPGYVAPQRPQTYYVDRANTFDQRAQQYQQWGMAPQATRYQQRATRVRGKHNLPATTTPVATRVY